MNECWAQRQQNLKVRRRTGGREAKEGEEECISLSLSTETVPWAKATETRQEGRKAEGEGFCYKRDKWLLEE